MRVITLGAAPMRIVITRVCRAPRVAALLLRGFTVASLPPSLPPSGALLTEGFLPVVELERMLGKYSLSDHQHQQECALAAR